VDILPIIITGPIIILYGIFIYNGKLLWFLISYKIRFKDEPDKDYKKKIYRPYGIIFILIGTVTLVIGGIVLYEG
jgi:hypothetical protein